MEHQEITALPEAQTDQRLQEEYIQLLRGLFKGIQVSRFLSGAYMTGILPIKKYGTQSALTDFYEYTMLEPGPLAEFVGFTEQEVKDLCKEQQIDFEQKKMVRRILLWTNRAYLSSM